MWQILKAKLGPASRKLFRWFDIYAPHVEVLNVYGTQNKGYAVSGWKLLTSRAKRHSLLPSLKSIGFMCQDWCFQPRDHVLWITTFATLATVDVRILCQCPPNADYPYSRASEILEALATRCPNLEYLVLRPHGRFGSVDHSHQLKEEDIPDNEWHDYIEAFQKLELLSVSEDWLYYPSLRELSQLPRLECLELWPGDLEGFDPQYNLCPKLPSGSFPALRSLNLKDLHPHVITELLSVRRMLKNIVALCIELEVKELDEDDQIGLSPEQRIPHRNNWIVHRFFPLLRNTPCLEHLIIRFVPPEEVIYCIGVSPVLDVMAKLPLRTVHLSQMHLGSGVLNIDLATIWPKVAKLSMPDQHASLQELSHFAAMPKLRHLTLMVDLTTTFTPLNAPTPRFSLRTLESSYGSMIKTAHETVEHNAR